MVSHNAMFYWYEPLLEYIEEEAKVMVEKLASMQEYGTDFVIRRHNKIIEDTEIIFNNTQPFSQFKFRGMNILSSVSVFKNTHVFFHCLPYHGMVPSIQGGNLCFFSCNSY